MPAQRRWRRPLAVLKIIVTRGSLSRRGYAPAGIAVPRRIVSLWPTVPLQPGLIDRASRSMSRACVCRRRHRSPGIKHLNRLENVLAAADGRGDSMLRRADAERESAVVSGAACNVFVLEAGRLSTPRVTRAVWPA